MHISADYSHISTIYRSNTTPYIRKHLILVLSLSCKNVQKTTYTIIYTIILYYYCMFYHPGCIYIFRNGSFSLRVGMCSTLTPTQKSKSPIPIPHYKLYQIFTQFTKITQNGFGTHFDKSLVFLTKINFQTI